MWEKLEIYKQLDKKEINSTFKEFGLLLSYHTPEYKLEQTSSIIKLSRIINELEQAIFIERDKGSHNLKVRTSIKPIDFYRRHKFTMLNIVTLGDIMNKYRSTSYPLTQEWNELAIFLSKKIKLEIEKYFQIYNTYYKIITNRKKIEPKDFALDNKYELLIYAAIKTKNKALLNYYLDKKLERPVMQISQSEFLKPSGQEIDESEFLKKIKLFALEGDFENIENAIKKLSAS